jgi:chorismate mutase/prephenate dehydratase
MSLISEAREKINAIDEQMVKLFEERMAAVLDVLKYKKEHNLAVFDSKREEEIIKKNVEFLKNKELKEYYLEFFSAVLSSSKKYQEDNYE